MSENKEAGQDTLLRERFALAAARIREISGLQAESGNISGDFWLYFDRTASFAVRLLDAWERQGAEETGKASLDTLRERCRSLYEDVLPENYDRCCGNPAYLSGLYGADTGRLLAFVYMELYSQIPSVYERDQEAMTIRLELFLEVYQAFVCAFEEGKEAPASGALQQIIYWFVSDYTETETEKRVGSQLGTSQDFLYRYVMESDLDDIRYLYASGEYIIEQEEQLAVYLNGLPPETIKKIADTFTEGYRMGFVVAGKDLAKKKTVNIRFPAGFERVIRQAVSNFREIGLESIIYRASASIFHRRGAARIGFCGAAPNKQFLYDHREDEALFLDRRYIGRKLEAQKRAYERYREWADVHGGPACLESFGETPFVPEEKEAAPHLDGMQRQLSLEYTAASGRLVNEYIKGDERSFTFIAFPTPAIGPAFPEIFDAIIEVNTLDYTLYQKIQQIMIDTLDQAEYVRIRGANGNRTDLCVALQTLRDASRETLFENCVADVNIPVGEVFTSPRLEGTNGLLHVTSVYLNGLEYKDLALTFCDGMITAYDCRNFSSPEENRKYIRDNVLFHHDSLPMGEFAIGTNTTAYVAARKYHIADRLPILIAEKMGPHFAVGDTCYSHSEDLPVYNPDGREMIARDNACSLLRHTDETKAYFNCHTDITIPYDELGEVTAVSGQKEWPIIRAGRFVLPGCEELNQ